MAAIESVLVTGARGKVGRGVVSALRAGGYSITECDLDRGVFELAEAGAPRYVQAELTNAGHAFEVVRGHDAVVHAAAFPEPTHNPAHEVFRNNMMATYNVLEASVRWGVSRFVHISSETVPGFIFAERDVLPDYLPIDEEHPVRPEDPYALSKYFGEQLMDSAVRRSDIRCISLRAPRVLWEGNYEQSLGQLVRDRSTLGPERWAYVDVDDLGNAIRLSVESDLSGHEVFYISNDDTPGGWALGAEVAARYQGRVEVRETDREDASPISSAKAKRLLGWEPQRSWRDFLDDEGRLKHG